MPLKDRINPKNYLARRIAINALINFPSQSVLDARDNFEAFARLLTGHSPALHHREWISALITFNNSEVLSRVSGSNTRICAPRDSAKTTWGSLFLAWVIGHNQDIRIILVSYSQEIALAIATTVKRYIESDVYREIFPHIKPGLQWRNLAWTVVRSRIIKDPTLLAVGTNGSIASRRADLILLDDPIKSSVQIASSQIREQMRLWYSEVLEPCLVKGGRVIVLGTRFRLDDIHGTLFIPHNGWSVISQSAILQDDSGGEYSYWEHHAPLIELKRKREQNPVSFASQYQNDPLPQSSQVIKPDWIVTSKSLPNSFDSIAIGVDLASSLKTTADYSAAVVVGKKLDRLYVLDAVRCRDTQTGFGDRLGFLVNNYSTFSSRISLEIENVQYQAAFVHYFKEYAANELLPCRVHGIKPKGDKLQRLLSISHFLETGRIIFSDTLGLLKTELLHFGYAENDDLVDAFVYAVLRLAQSKHLEASEY
jgi:predicted phage terminase large subunit-like protein